MSAYRFCAAVHLYESTKRDYRRSEQFSANRDGARMPSTVGLNASALVTWTKGRPRFTPAGLLHYEAACAEVHVPFLPQAIRTAKDLCQFLRSLLQASVLARGERSNTGRAANDQASKSSLSSLRTLAERALCQVAQATSDDHAHCLNKGSADPRNDPRYPQYAPLFDRQVDGLYNALAHAQPATQNAVHRTGHGAEHFAERDRHASAPVQRSAAGAAE
jgi:hypothetical protein